MSETQPTVPVRPRSGRPRSQPDKAHAARRDPARSHIDGMREGRLTGDGYQPDKFHYVWVDKTRVRMGVEYYEMAGYKVVTPDDGVRVTGRFRTRDGEIEMLGHVLMACSKERHKEIVRYGVGGDTGLERAARVERSISNPRELAKNLRLGMRDITRRLPEDSLTVREARQDDDDDDLGVDQEEA